MGVPEITGSGEIQNVGHSTPLVAAVKIRILENTETSHQALFKDHFNIIPIVILIQKTKQRNNLYRIRRTQIKLKPE